MAGDFSRFSLATATTIQELKNSSKNENIVKSTAFCLSMWKKWCLEKRIAEEIGNYEPPELNTCSSDSMPVRITNQQNLANDDCISSKVIRIQTDAANSLNFLAVL